MHALTDFSVSFLPCSFVPPFHLFLWRGLLRRTASLSTPALPLHRAEGSLTLGRETAAADSSLTLKETAAAPTGSSFIDKLLCRVVSSCLRGTLVIFMTGLLSRLTPVLA